MIPLKDEKYRPLLERREEIKEQINKLMREYNAIGEILQENIKLKEYKNKERED